MARISSAGETSTLTIAPAPVRPRRSWSDKFADACRGLKRGIRGHSSFSVHFFFAAVVVLTAVILHCGLTEWCLLIACIGFVLSAELFNSAIEHIYHGLDDSMKPAVRPALDIAAGAVLVASVAAALIGSLVFLRGLTALVFPEK